MDCRIPQEFRFLQDRNCDAIGKKAAEKRQAYENGKNGMHKNTSGMFYYILIEKRKKYADKAWFILLTQRGERCY